MQGWRERRQKDGNGKVECLVVRGARGRVMGAANAAVRGGNGFVKLRLFGAVECGVRCAVVRGAVGGIDGWNRVGMHVGGHDCRVRRRFGFRTKKCRTVVVVEVAMMCCAGLFGGETGRNVHTAGCSRVGLKFVNVTVVVGMVWDWSTCGGRCPQRVFVADGESSDGGALWGLSMTL